jgi:hypothetical protein
MGKGGNAIGQTDDVKSNVLQKSAGENVINDVSSSSDQKRQSNFSIERRWYNKGGIQGVSEIGMGFNVGFTPFLFVTYLSPSEESGPFLAGYSFPQVFFAVLGFNIIAAFFVHRMRTLFCLVCCSTYMASLLALFTLQSPIVPTCISILAIATWRVGICMSVCLHRYSAHAAFKCGPLVQFVLNLLGCAANQGGPIWWASQHRCHHKHCELPRDPHSALQVGTERAFSFFLERSTMEEEFAPKHNDNWYLRLVDTWCFTVVSAELFFAYNFFGREGLFVSYTSLWICQTITLWFNIANHPPTAPGKVCKAASYRVQPEEWYPPFQLLHRLHPFLATVVGEGGHDDHHIHFMLAKRDSTDLAFYLFILPLKMLGLVWDVKETRLV